MGTVAPLARAPDYGRKLLLALQDHAEQRIRDSKEPDLEWASRVLADALDNPSSREAALFAITSFLLQALSGCIPDP